MREFTITAACTFGLESVLKREIMRLGYQINKSGQGFVSIRGGAQDILKLNLRLRTAARVLVDFGGGGAATFDELFDTAKNINWHELIPKNGKFDVTHIRCVRSNLFSKSDCQRVIKKAMAEQLKSAHKTAVLPESGAYYPVHVRIYDNIAYFWIDTSGESLHKRGYRASQGDAPLKETLAAGLVLLSGYDGSRPFADPLCGSGTILIEAAMIAKNMAPGLKRNFIFESWGILSQAENDALRKEAQNAARPAPATVSSAPTTTRRY